uniref:C-type lectin domain-containing protein n=1 Tax=Cyprinus carpio TaxID=7962 RepID=A0A8C1LMI0_CYPCA
FFFFIAFVLFVFIQNSVFHAKYRHLTIYISCIFLVALMHMTFSQTRMFYFMQKSMNWSDAQAHCRQNYIDLATMDDQTDRDEMMRVIRQVYNGDVWTGLSRTDAKASWIWSDLSSSTFMPWAPDQPNNLNSNRNIQFYHVHHQRFNLISLKYNKILTRSFLFCFFWVQQFPCLG